MYYTRSPKTVDCSRNMKKKNLQIQQQGGQKNRNGKRLQFFCLLHRFLLVSPCEKFLMHSEFCMQMTATGNASDLQPLKDALSSSSADTKQGGSSNLESAFQMANQTFAPNTNNLKLILVITDGQFADSNLLSTVKPVLNSLLLQKVLVLLYSFDRTAGPSAALSQVACYVNGTYERVEKTVENPLWTLRSYFGIIAYWRLAANKFRPYWVKPYRDTNSLGMVITAAYPTFAPDNYTLIGVVGYDINLNELGGIATTDFSAALVGRASSDPSGIVVNPVALPCNVSLSNRTCRFLVFFFVTLV